MYQPCSYLGTIFGGAVKSLATKSAIRMRISNNVKHRGVICLKFEGSFSTSLIMLGLDSIKMQDQIFSLRKCTFVLSKISVITVMI